MFCNQCGKKNSNDAIFCNSCGTRIDGVHRNSGVKDNYQRTPSKLLTSLILGILSLFFLFFLEFFIGLLLGIIGVTFGLIGMKEVSESKSGYIGMARLAVYCNIIGIIIPMIIFLFQPI